MQLMGCAAKRCPGRLALPAPGKCIPRAAPQQADSSLLEAEHGQSWTARLSRTGPAEDFRHGTIGICRACPHKASKLLRPRVQFTRRR